METLQLEQKRAELDKGRSHQTSQILQDAQQGHLAVNLGNPSRKGKTNLKATQRSSGLPLPLQTQGAQAGAGLPSPPGHWAGGHHPVPQGQGCPHGNTAARGAQEAISSLCTQGQTLTYPGHIHIPRVKPKRPELYPHPGSRPCQGSDPHTQGHTQTHNTPRVTTTCTSTKATLILSCPVPRLAYFGLPWVRAKALASLGAAGGSWLGGCLGAARTCFGSWESPLCLQTALPLFGFRKSPGLPNGRPLTPRP